MQADELLATAHTAVSECLSADAEWQRRGDYTSRPNGVYRSIEELTDAAAALLADVWAAVVQHGVSAYDLAEAEPLTQAVINVARNSRLSPRP